MDDIQLLHARQRGFKEGIIKLIMKVEDISSKLEDVNSESITKPRRLMVTTAITQLKAKWGQITELDSTIANTIQTEGELETEICDADTYQSTLDECVAVLTEFVRKASQPPIPSTLTLLLLSIARDHPAVSEETTASDHELVVAKKLPPQVLLTRYIRVEILRSL